MTTNTMLMLVALTKSANSNTAEHARDILEDRKIAFDSGGLGAEKLATLGNLGGLLATVMTGDVRESYAMADELNTLALDLGGMRSLI